MLSFGPFGQLGEILFRWGFDKDGGFFRLGASFFAPDGSGDDGANDLLERSSVVARDPFCELQEGRGDQRFGIDQVGKEAEGEISFGCFVNTQDGPGRGPVAKGDAHAASWKDLEVFWNGIVEDKFRRPVDQDAGSEGHEISGPSSDSSFARWRAG